MLAIDAIVDCTVYGNADDLKEAVMQENAWNKWSGGVLEALEAIEELPSAQPDVPDTNVGDMVSRAAAIDILDAYQVMVENGEENPYAWARLRMSELPPAQPVRKKGRWIVIVKGCKLTSYKCSECGRYIAGDTGYDVKKDYPFCHCGAEMR